jgi:protein O-mannosyl-transferase
MAIVGSHSALQRLETTAETVLSARGRRRWTFLLALFAVFYLIALVLHYPGLTCPMVYDSHEWIKQRAHVFERNDALEVMSIVHVRPLFMLTLYGNYRLGGMNVVFFRLVNLAFLAAAGIALFVLLSLAYDIPRTAVGSSNAQKQAVALAFSLFFVMHPLQSYVVLYIWQREAILACLFYFSTIASYLAVRSGHYDRPLTGYTVTGLLFLAGLMCKENVITAPIALLLAELTLFGQSPRRLVSKGLTIGLMTLPGLAVYLIVTRSLFGAESEVSRGVLDRLFSYFAASGLTVAKVLMTECRVVCGYLATIVVPLPRSFTLVHAMTVSTSFFTPPVTASACIAVPGIIALGVMLIRRAPLISFGILLFFVCLTPESLLVPQYLVFGYRAILPMAAVFMVLGGLVLKEWRHLQDRENERRFTIAFVAVSLAMALGLGVATHVKAKRWNPLSVWMDAYESLPPWSKSVEKRPYVDILTNLSGILANQGDTAKAISLCKQGLAIAPDQGMLHNNMGVALLHSGKVEEAVERLKKSVDLRPGALVPLNNLGNALLAARRVPEAIEVYRKAIQIGPHQVQPYLNLGAACLQQKRYDEAVRILEKAAALDPRHAKVRANLGIALVALGRFPEAITHLSKAVEIDPKLSLAHYHLGIAWENLGETGQAAKEFAEAVERAPRWAQGHFALARVMIKLGHIPKAIEEYEQVLRLEPNNFISHNNLARAFVMRSDFAKAAKHAREALKLKPGFPEAEESLKRALEGLGEAGSTERKAAP